MGTTSLKDKVIDRVQRYDWTTYVELGNLEGESVGAGTWAHQDINTNVVFWAGMSEEVATAIDEAFAEGYIHPHGSDSLVYMMDGGIQKRALGTSSISAREVMYRQRMSLEREATTLPEPRGRSRNRDGVADMLGVPLGFLFRAG